MSISLVMRDPEMMPARMAELFGRLSLAFDIANDAPYGKAVRSVVLAVELGRLAGANGRQLRDTYWLSLFAYLGCTGFGHEESAGERSAGPRRDADGRHRGFRSPACSECADTSIQLAQIVGAGPRIRFRAGRAVRALGRARAAGPSLRRGAVRCRCAFTRSPTPWKSPMTAEAEPARLPSCASGPAVSSIPRLCKVASRRPGRTVRRHRGSEHSRPLPGPGTEASRLGGRAPDG